MLIDSHIHVGQFWNYYFAPSAIHQLVECMGIDFYAVSSTTMCEENYPKVLDEIHKLQELDGEKVLPIMWITPEGLEGNIAWFLESDIQWRCLKIHPFLHQKEWEPDGENILEVIDLAREFNIPLLIHTGDEFCCQSGKYESLIASNCDIDFILAHGRPLKDSLLLCQKYKNVYVDSAFMPVEKMGVFMKNHLSHKLLWGTDMCMPKYFYPERKMEEYYKEKVDRFREICTGEQFDEVTYSNAKNLFKI